eukprot:c9960_g1_i3.p1 GENE.c9960_g1_i3~~c9960_g1_i3.p1  ORF type:complete len:133 (-),score=33.11 c9960_g1_i3:312-710(-)
MPERVVLKSLSEFFSRDRSRIQKPTSYLVTALSNQTKRICPQILPATPASVRRRVYWMNDQQPLMNSLSFRCYELLGSLTEDQGHAVLDAFLALLARGIETRAWSAMFECLCLHAKVLQQHQAAVKREVKWG